MERRPLVRFFACKQDLSHEPLDTLLPREVVDGREPYMIIGAMAGGCDPVISAR
jgi:molybdopterin synthase sulfur carrier subunit